MRRLPDVDADRQLRIITGIRRVVQAEAIRFSSSELTRRTLHIVSGTLTQSLEGVMRWSGNLEIALHPEEAIPSDPSNVLAPFGTQIHVHLGIEYQGTISVVPYGVYTLAASSAAISGDHRIVSLTLSDLAERVASNRYVSPKRYTAGIDLATLAAEVVTDRDPSLTPNTAGLDEIGVSLRKSRTFGLTAETDPWAELTETLAAHNRVVWFNRDGDLRVARPKEDPAVTNLITLPAPSVGVEFNQRPPNVVVARSSAADVQAYGIWENTHASSPTFVGGAYGRVTRFYASPVIDTNSEAREAARTIGRRLLDAGASWKITGSFDPTWDLEDTMLIPADLAGRDDDLPVMLRAISLDLTGDVSYTAHSATTAEDIPET